MNEMSRIARPNQYVENLDRESNLNCERDELIEEKISLTAKNEKIEAKIALVDAKLKVIELELEF